MNYTTQSEITKMNKEGFYVNCSLGPPKDGKLKMFIDK